MTKPFYTSAAQQDFADILNYIARDNPSAAVAWVEKVEAKCLTIAKNPSLGDMQRHLGDGIRASVVGRYVIFYREANHRVEILRVIPGDRNITHL
ncbi:MAG: type II toxin-antitoxin system RelE/ParE family toxin [Planctomycetes bacterium]|nr:type II toxin-antitoxin system RelE/ParE family toxin [Planctomycetota bacterium]